MSGRRRVGTLVGVVLGLVLGFGAGPSVGADDDTFPLTVRDGATGKPLAGVTVYVLLPELLRSEKLLGSLRERNVDELAQRLGTRVDADEKGVAAIPRDALESGWCVVVGEGRFGAISFYDPDLEEVHELEVHPDASLKLRVIGPGGEPVGGIPLSLRRPPWGGYPWIWRGTTAAETGEVVVSHVGWRLRRNRATSCTAVIEVPGVAVDTGIAWPRETDAAVELQLPATGALHVQPTGPGAKGRLRLTLREHPLEQWAPSIEQDVAAGEVCVFPHVGLFSTCRVEAFPFDRLYRKPDPLVLDGPTEAGEKVRGELVVEALNILIAGRIVDAQGEPVRGQSFSAWIRAPGSSGLSGVETDDEGRFRLVVDRFTGSGSPSGATVTIELVPKDQSMAGDTRVRHELELPLAAGLTDVGDLVLPAAPVVLSGRVVDTAGQGVPEVYVFVSQGRALTKEEAGQRWHSTRPVASDEKHEDPTWAWSPQLRAISDADGRFQMTGDVLEGRPCRFAVHKPGYVMRAPQLAHLGATDEELVLERTGRLEGSIRLPPGTDPKCLRLVMRGRPAARDALQPGMWGSESPPPDDVGEIVVMPGWVVLGQVTVPARDGVQPFVFNELRPGTGTLDVCVGDDPDPIARVHAVEIPEGEVTRIERLDPLEATDLIRRVRLTIEDQSGTLPPGLEVRVFRGHGRQTAGLMRPSLPADGGPVAVRLAAGMASRLDLDVRAPGRRAVRLLDVRGQAEVRLEPGILIRVQPPADWTDRAEGQAHCSAHPVADPSTRTFRFHTDRWGTSSVAAGAAMPSFLLPTAGRWLLTLHVDGEAVASRTVEVRGDVSEEQVFELE